MEVNDTTEYNITYANSKFVSSKSAIFAQVQYVYDKTALGFALKPNIALGFALCYVLVL